MTGVLAVLAGGLSDPGTYLSGGEAVVRLVGLAEPGLGSFPFVDDVADRLRPPGDVPGSQLVETTAGRVGLTVALGALTLATVLAGQILRRRLSGRIGPALARSFVTVVVLAVVGLISATVVAIWGWDDVVVRAASESIPREQVPQIVLSVAVLVATHFVSVFFKQLYAELLGDSDAVSEHQREVTYRVTQLVLYGTAILVVFGIWDQNLSGLLIGAGFAGIVLGMAARQTLGNVLAGFVLMFSRPFEVGDWIEVGKDGGIVTDITVINTRIRTFDGEYVIVPNNVIREQEVTNKSRTGRLRVEVEVGVDYDNDVERARRLAREAVVDVDRVLDVPTPGAVVTEFGSSAVLLSVRGWIENPSAQRYWRTKTEMIGAIKDAFEEEGIAIPFPQREVSDRVGPRGSDRGSTAAEARSDQPPATDGGGDSE